MYGPGKLAIGGLAATGIIIWPMIVLALILIMMGIALAVLAGRKVYQAVR